MKYKVCPRCGKKGLSVMKLGKVNQYAHCKYCKHTFNRGEFRA